MDWQGPRLQEDAMPAMHCEPRSRGGGKDAADGMRVDKRVLETGACSRQGRVQDREDRGVFKTGLERWIGKRVFKRARCGGPWYHLGHGVVPDGEEEDRAVALRKRRKGNGRVCQ